MTWEEKTQMIRFSNTSDKINFQRIVLENLKTFDSQAWDMFATCVELIEEEIKKDSIFFKQVYEYSKNVDDEKLHWRAAIRLEVLNEIIKKL